MTETLAEHMKAEQQPRRLSWYETLRGWGWFNEGDFDE